MLNMDAGDLAEWVTAAAGFSGAAGYLAYAVRGRSSHVFGPSFYHGDRARPAIALTFDDGPSESTPALLDILAAHSVSATFFMCGKNVRRLPAIAQEVRRRGHEIGNHSDTHPRFDFKPPEFIFREMALAQETIKLKVGVTPRYFRAPYGVRWFGVRRAQQRLGLTGVMWTVIGQDWKQPAANIEQRILQGARNGAILCLHDARAMQTTPDIRSTLEAVAAAVPKLQERGFRFETVSQILCPAN